jgi:hypothetical protein
MAKPEYIERAAAKHAADLSFDMTETEYDILCKELDRVPAADVAPVVHGRWIEKSAPARKIYFECSHCGAQENKHTAIKGHYCWRCGARMDGEEP